MPQIEKYSGEIEVIAYWNDCDKSIGEYRQALLEEARGEYVCFIDDDDLVPPYYCDEIIGALGKDYVGFEVELFNDGVRQKPAYHSLSYHVWFEDEQAFYRRVTHLNPIRREIALKERFAHTGAGEDEDWSRRVEKHVMDQNYIDKVMYSYRHNSRDTSFGSHHSKGKYSRPKVNFKFFYWHPSSKITTET